MRPRLTLQPDGTWRCKCTCCPAEGTGPTPGEAHKRWKQHAYDLEDARMRAQIARMYPDFKEAQP